jgi:membrane protein DedA with SNARE-associated domain
MLEWITSTINSLGYLGIALMMCLETVITPIPSEVIMPLAGFTVAQGKMVFLYVVVAGTIGSVLGALPWYYVGRRLGEERLEKLAGRYGKWLGISAKDIGRARSWFDKYGGRTVFFCRLVPGVRTWISVPAGISHMPLVPFLVYSALGTLLWTGLLAYAGYMLGTNYSLVAKYMAPASRIVMVALLATFVIWVIRRKG